MKYQSGGKAEPLPAVKEVVEQLMRRAPCEWNEEHSTSLPGERYTTTLYQCWHVAIVREERADPSQGEASKDMYELFLNQKCVGEYCECNYQGGGRLVAGDSSIYDLYRHIERGLVDDHINSREWRSAKMQLPKRHLAVGAY